MSHLDALFAKVRAGNSDTSVRFDALRALLDALGFAERIRGSHHIFGRAGVHEILNLQRDGRNAKDYQVRQVRRAILKYNLRLRG